MDQNEGSTTTISWPGANWHMLWASGGFQNFQLDLVGFLAVLGESAVTSNSQVSALSPLFYLPRIIPAPQALLPPERKRTLPETKASVTSVHSGNTKEHVHHVAHVLLGKDMKPFTVRCVRVTKNQKILPQAGRVMTTLKSVSTLLPTTQEKKSTPLVTAALKGPLTWVTILGCFLSIGLFVSSIVFGDGFSLIATLLLSCLSTLTGIANGSRLKLPHRPKNDAPPGDTVVRYPNGSYLIVRCEEEVARELYFAPEEIEYVISSQSTYRIIALLGTIILMLGIIALANAKLQLQIAWAGAYVISNAAHWVVAAVPQRLHWDLSCYNVREEGVQGGPYNDNFTEALWNAILLTKDTRWAKNGKAAPQTQAWDLWLKEAENQARLVLEEEKDQPLKDPIFPVDEHGRGKMWKQPKVWDPKTAWNRISSDTAKIEAVSNPLRSAATS